MRKMGQEVQSHASHMLAVLEAKPTPSFPQRGGGGSPHGFCNSVSNENQMEQGSHRRSLSHIIGGEKALSIRNSVGLLIFNFIFAKNVSTLVVVVKLEPSCL